MSDDHANPARGKKRLRDLLTAYLDFQRSLQVSPYTIKGIRYGANGFLLWLEQTCRVRYVDELRRRHIPAWLKYLSGYRTSKGFALKPRRREQAY